MDISKFRSTLNGDGARPNLFRVTIDLPSNLAGLASGPAFGEKLSMTVRAAQIPGSTIGKIPQPYMGREIYLAGNRIFQDWNVTVVNDEDYIVRSVMENWMKAINSHVTNVRADAAAGSFDYVSQATVEHLGKTKDSVIATYKMINCWPTDLSPIELDFGQNDTLEEFTATFSFDAWENTVGVSEASATVQATVPLG